MKINNAAENRKTKPYTNPNRYRMLSATLSNYCLNYILVDVINLVVDQVGKTTS